MKLLKFYAPWCQPCKTIQDTVFDFVEKHNFELVEYNIDNSEDIVSEHGVMSIPTCVLMDGNKEVGRVIGAKPLSEFEALLK